MTWRGAGRRVKQGGAQAVSRLDKKARQYSEARHLLDSRVTVCARSITFGDRGMGETGRGVDVECGVGARRRWG